MKSISRRLRLAVAMVATIAAAAFLFSVSGASQATAAPSLPLAGRVIVIDPGHGGHDPGTEQTYTFCSLTPPPGETLLHEKVITLAIAYKFKADLEALGATVYMTRETDVFVDLWDRVAMSADVSLTPKGQRDHVAKRPTDIFISIHVNSVDYKTNFDEIGVYSYFAPGKDLSLKIAPVLQKEMAKNTRVINPMDFRVVDHNSSIPSILIETGFITNAATCRDLNNDAYQARFAAAITDGVENYFNHTGAGAGVNVTVTDPTKHKDSKLDAARAHHNSSNKNGHSGKVSTHRKHR